MRKGVALVNLGTPDSFQPRDVYKYLIEFLTDKRVIDLSFLKRQLLVRALIVPLRYRNSARSYKEIWMKEGSPLLVYGQRVKDLLQESLGDGYRVKLAMRYQNPSIKSTLEAFKEERISDITVIPLFPQYTSACTGSIYEKVFKELSNWEEMPTLRFNSHFYNQSSFIKAHIDIGKSYGIDNYDHVLFSFHGLPEKHLLKANNEKFCLRYRNCCEKLCNKNQFCYKAQCNVTAREIAEGLGIEKSRYSISFQSRLGKDPWLTPFTSKLMQTLPESGIKRVLVFCPSFVCDCLETLHEIAIEYDEIFKSHGGEKLTLVKGLNEHPLWIQALKEIVLDGREDKLEVAAQKLESMANLT